MNDSNTYCSLIISKLHSLNINFLNAFYCQAIIIFITIKNAVSYCQIDARNNFTDCFCQQLERNDYQLVGSVNQTAIQILLFKNIYL